MNRIRSSQSTSARRRAGLDVGGEGLAVVDAVHRVLDVALRARAPARWSARPGARRSRCWVVRECSQVEPVGPADPDDAAVGEVHEPVAAASVALLAVERAVVRGDRRVDAVAGDRAGQVEQGAGHAGPQSGARRRHVRECPARRPRAHVGAGAEDRQVAESGSNPCSSASGPERRLHLAATDADHSLAARGRRGGRARGRRPSGRSAPGR